MRSFTNEEMRDIILNTAHDVGAAFAWKDRDDDEELSVDDLSNAIRYGVVSLADIGEAFLEGVQSV